MQNAAFLRATETIEMSDSSPVDEAGDSSVAGIDLAHMHDIEAPPLPSSMPVGDRPMDSTNSAESSGATETTGLEVGVNVPSVKEAEFPPLESVVTVENSSFEQRMKDSEVSNDAVETPPSQNLDSAPMQQTSAQEHLVTIGSVITEVSDNLNAAPLALTTQENVETVADVQEVEALPPGSSLSGTCKNGEVALPFYKLFIFADCLDIVLMLLGTIGGIGNGLSKPLMTLVFGQLANAFGENTNNTSKLVHEVSHVSLRYVYLGIGAGFAAFFETTFWMCAGERQATRIRALYLKSILRQDVGFFDKETSTGEVLGRMSEDTILIQDAVGEKVGKFVQLVSTFCGGFILAFSKGWRLSLVVSCALPLLVVAGATMAMMISKMANRGQMAYAEAGNIVQQVVGGIRTVASFTGEEKAVKDYDIALEKAYKAGVYQGLSSGLGMGCTLLVLYLSYALALWYGSRLILHKGYSGGSVINVILSVLMGGMALGQASPCLRAFAAGQAAACKMFEVIHRIPAIDIYNMDGLVLPNIRGDIDIQDVDFSYPSRPDVQIFKNFSLSIPSGMTAALVGESGSGKSTVISLLERFYDPQGGMVLIDGINIKTMQLKWLRQQIGLVSQEPVLFGVSILENVAYGKDGATREEVQAACESANAAKFINKMPQGYDTHVGHQGTQLSGGQKQRIAIARAILKNPRILLLDEATSALDAESERLVQEALERVMVDRTTVIVAHRLSTIRNAESISVVQHGKIVERGTHSTLLANPDGQYSQLIRFQEMHHGENPESGEQEKPISSSSAACRRNSYTIEHNRQSTLEPRIEQRTHSRGGFLSCFKPKSEQAPVSTTSSILRLATLNKPEAPVFILGSLAAAANGVIFPMFGLLISSILGIFYDSDRSKLREGGNFWAAMFVVLAFACFVVIPCQMFSFAYVGQNLIRRIRYLTFRMVVRQEIGWFDARENSSGAISARLSTNAAHVRGMVGDSLALTVQNLATVGAGLIIAFSASWQLALVILALVPLLSLQGFMQVKLMTGFSADAKIMYEEASHVASDAISSIRSVASFCAEEKMLKLYEDKCKVPLKNGIRLGIISGGGMGISNFVLFSSYSLSFWYGAQLIKDNKTTFQKVFKVFFAITMSAIGVSHATGLAPDLGRVRASVISVFSMLDRKSKIDPADTQGTTLEVLHGNIQFQRVSFKYPSRPDVQIFRDFSFFLEAGKTAALVGESGSGKSTAISLLQRFYDPDSGRIFIDGTDIRSFQLRWLRQQMALVGQEPVLFSGTLKSNIGYGRDGVTDDEIMAAAEASNAHKFISRLPRGYDTEVGERGTQLSGGQKQRIAIARAIVKNPKILLLDEATSALDAESERLVQDALNRVMQKRTVVVVAHRLSTIVNADEILVVKNGVIAEQGRHKELLQIEDGVYSMLVRLHIGVS